MGHYFDRCISVFSVLNSGSLGFSVQPIFVAITWHHNVMRLYLAGTTMNNVNGLDIVKNIDSLHAHGACYVARL